MRLRIKKIRALPLFVDYLFDESLTTLDHRLKQFKIYIILSWIYIQGRPHPQNFFISFLGDIFNEFATPGGLVEVLDPPPVTFMKHLLQIGFFDNMYMFIINLVYYKVTWAVHFEFCLAQGSAEVHWLFDYRYSH